MDPNWHYQMFDVGDGGFVDLNWIVGIIKNVSDPMFNPVDYPAIILLKQHAAIYSPLSLEQLRSQYIKMKSDESF